MQPLPTHCCLDGRAALKEAVPAEGVVGATFEKSEKEMSEACTGNSYLLPAAVNNFKKRPV